MPPPGTAPTPPRPATTQIRAAVSALQDLPGWYPTVQKVLRLAVDPRVNPLQIEIGLSVEPAIAELVLRLANSPFCGSAGQSENIPAVLQAIDHNEFRSLLRTVLIVGLLDSLAGEVSRAEPLKKTSLAAGAAAFAIAAETHSANPLELLNVGLLHNAGEMAAARVYPENYDEMEQLSLSEPRFLAERQALGFECRQLGRRLLEGWCLPRFFAEAVEHWRDPLARSLDSEFRRRVCRVHLAVRLSRGYLDGLPFDNIPIDEKILLYSGVGYSRLEAVWRRLPQDFDNLRAAITAHQSRDGKGL